MASRAKLLGDVTPPPPNPVTPPMHTPSSNTHDFYLQCAMQTERSIGELKTKLDHLATASGKHSEKLEKLNDTILTARGFLKAITWIGGICGVVALALLGEILKLLGDHLSKH